MTESNGELLIRIDERLASLNREITENIKPGIEKINGHVDDVIKECASNSTRGRMNTRLVIFAISLATGLGIYAIGHLIA